MGDLDERMQIVLARHGKPRLDQWAWITPRELGDWLRAYNAADVLVGGASPLTATRAVQSGVIVSSPLRRCLQSARALAPGREILAEEVFREAGIPHAPWRFPPLPFAVWSLFFRLAWVCGYSSNSESLSLARLRARIAAERLITLARQHDSVFVVGHGIMTALIARQLVLKGWCGPKRPAHRHWEHCIYRSMV
jgi:broad specificity phosphatase PhoE